MGPRAYLVNFKLTVSDSKGRSVTRELKEGDASPLLGLGIGSEADATALGLEGKIRITGGSDKSGVPMRPDVHGPARKYVLLSRGVGLRDAERGGRTRKLVRGNQISEEIYQVNCSFDGEIPAEPKKEEAETKE
ncbi:ribosomal protein S6E (S10) [Cenarchaeum symbiosum A]|uniref:Small ribosomal subunit protein eS6 n=1 Tax=Cenarchaeum symbiosum (strain A) TaxID=414004 RepID=A0RYX5_CENSY|nr:ribosomal protein S6E (S10) [Cenarchaeum symbiosum A]